jgi:hypothetical protein
MTKIPYQTVIQTAPETSSSYLTEITRVVKLLTLSVRRVKIGCAKRRGSIGPCLLELMTLS